MEISLNRRSMNCFKKTSEILTVCEAMAESVVPDVQEDIRQVLTTSFITKIRSKDIDIEEISIKAELNAVVMYSSENGIEKLEMTLPVNAKIPAREIDSSSIINADIKVQSWDLRLINPRKVSLKADVCVKAACYRVNELVWYDMPEELPENLFVKSDSVVIRVADTVTEKTITANEEFDLADSSDIKLISAFAAYQTESSEAVGDKLIIRGRADIETVFLADGKLNSRVFSVPFSQLFDVGGDGNGECEAVILSTGEYYDIADGKFTAELHAVMQLVCYKNFEMTYSSDAYSCQHDTELQYESMEFCSGCDTVSLKDNIQLIYDSQHDIAELLTSKAYVIKTEVTDGAICAVVGAELICRDADNEIYCGKIRGNVEFPIENSEQYKVYSAEIANIRAVLSGNSIELSGEVRVSAKCEKYSSLSIISNIEELETVPEASPSAYIVFSDGDLWSIAKKYRSSCDRIIEIYSDGRKKYFVPVIK